MAIVKKLGVLTAISVIGLMAWYLSLQQNDSIPSAPVDVALVEAMNLCEGITERAAADLVAVVEFQKLEIAGRKARVFKMCMRDRGFVENADWRTYSMPLAMQLAKETKVSTDAAIESLSRTDMMRATGEGERPLYWVKP